MFENTWTFFLNNNPIIIFLTLAVYFSFFLYIKYVKMNRNESDRINLYERYVQRRLNKKYINKREVK